MAQPAYPPTRKTQTPLLLARERVEGAGTSTLSDGELLALCGAEAVAACELPDLAWRTVDDLRAQGLPPGAARTLAVAFELGRRAGWAPPRRGERCLNPGRVYELLRHAAHAEREGFYVVLLDVRGRLLRAVQVAEGSLSQCPVSPRDALRPAVREGAHSVVFAHNHPSGDPSPSPEDQELTERLRAAAELVGVLARDHVIVAAGGYYSFVEAGRWRR